MPFLSIVRRPLVETRSFTQRFSEATQKRRSWRLGMKRRRVLFIACETLLPLVVRLPVTWQTLDIKHLCGSRMVRMGAFLGQESVRPRRRRGHPRAARDSGTGAAGCGGRARRAPGIALP